MNKNSLLNGLTMAQISKILPSLTETEKLHLLEELTLLDKLKTREAAQTNFIEFVKQIWPEYIHGDHFARMADAFQRIADGSLKRLTISMPPRHGKSYMASYLFPAWYMGKFPGHKIMQASHTTDLAVGFGRQVRNLLDTPAYQNIFPGVELRADSKAAGRWNTNHNGDYNALGALSAAAGKGAHLFIVDDPVSEQEALLAESNPAIYERVYDWYLTGPRQRMQQGGAIIIVMCMTGDTPILMPDGTEKNLKDIKVGDTVATYDNGELSTAKILNWRSSGLDSVYTIKTSSGRSVKANERHPFLVDTDGSLEWVRLKNLKPGMKLVSTKAAGANIAEFPVQEMGATSPHIANTSVKYTTKKPDGGMGTTDKLRNNGEHTGSKVGMGLPKNSLTLWLSNEEIYATCANNPPVATIPERTGITNSASTTTTKQGKYEDSYVTTVISQSDTQKLKQQPEQSQNTSDFTTDEIVSIEFSGEEEVFDVEVERTENFIANGLVSHNTRWSKEDLVGKVLKAEAQRQNLDEGDPYSWEVIEFPAILNVNTPDERPLWPEMWTIEDMHRLRDEMPTKSWMAQYMQSPTSDVTAVVKREWWRKWEDERPPTCESILMAWDTAFETTTRADYSACTTWGVFYHPDARGKEQAHLILLNAFKEKLEFPDLKRKAIEQYNLWEPDSMIIEKKSSGAPLIYELRAMGIPVQEFTPVRGNDKLVRLNACSDIFASGRVWAPPTRWADEVIEEISSFGGTAHDDYVDSMTLAMLRFRQGGYVTTDKDQEDEPEYFKSQRTKGYY